MGWAFLPPLQRTVRPLALTTSPSTFPHDLSSWRNPSLTGPMAHAVSRDAPSGLVDGDGAGLPVGLRTGPDLLPLPPQAPQPVQRTTTRPSVPASALMTVTRADLPVLHLDPAVATAELAVEESVPVAAGPEEGGPEEGGPEESVPDSAAAPEGDAAGGWNDGRATFVPVPSAPVQRSAGTSVTTGPADSGPPTTSTVAPSRRPWRLGLGPPLGAVPATAITAALQRSVVEPTPAPAGIQAPVLSAPQPSRDDSLPGVPADVQRSPSPEDLDLPLADPAPAGPAGPAAPVEPVQRTAWPAPGADIPSAPTLGSAERGRGPESRPEAATSAGSALPVHPGARSLDVQRAVSAQGEPSRTGAQPETSARSAEGAELPTVIPGASWPVPADSGWSGGDRLPVTPQAQSAVAQRASVTAQLDAPLPRPVSYVVPVPLPGTESGLQPAQAQVLTLMERTGGSRSAPSVQRHAGLLSQAGAMTRAGPVPAGQPVTSGVQTATWLEGSVGEPAGSSVQLSATSLPALTEARAAGLPAGGGPRPPVPRLTRPASDLALLAPPPAAQRLDEVPPAPDVPAAAPPVPDVVAPLSPVQRAEAPPVVLPAAAGGAPAVAATTPDQLEELARRLVAPLSRRLRAELLLDRERRGLRTDAR